MLVKSAEMIKTDKRRETKSELTQLFSLSISIIKNWIVSIDSSHSSAIHIEEAHCKICINLVKYDLLTV